MDYVLFHIKRIADNLRENGVVVPGKSYPPPSSTEPVPQEMEVTSSKSSRSRLYLPRWLNEHRYNPVAMVIHLLYRVIITKHHCMWQDFMELLLAHLCEQLFPDGRNAEQIFIKDDTLYEHPLLDIKYTSYEVQQERDIIHLGYGQTGIMVHMPMLSEDENEPWSYANVLAVYHVIVRTASNPEPQTLKVLWVQWMQCGMASLTGLNSQNYTQVSFVPWSSIPGSVFDFIDPSHIIHACHLIPAFNVGQTHDLLDPSITRDSQGDWCAYYANRYGPSYH